MAASNSVLCSPRRRGRPGGENSRGRSGCRSGRGRPGSVAAGGRTFQAAPGGALGPGEDHRTVVRRELGEEIGVAGRPPYRRALVRRRPSGRSSATSPSADRSCQPARAARTPRPWTQPRRQDRNPPDATLFVADHGARPTY
ncbi:NUDIX domain-containing protein [Streptosporangium sp. NPDC001559]|uniref:NUDIX domain-containing protein n=1 Tax=Streptosporangium sp. NPDC001559 TaxID=3366187 RepID=UPI0036F13183